MPDFLHFLSAHGISPLLPFAMAAMVAGGCLVVIYQEVRRKAHERRIGKSGRKSVSSRRDLGGIIKPMDKISRESDSDSF